jgi:hypothetical protein
MPPTEAALLLGRYPSLSHCTFDYMPLNDLALWASERSQVLAPHARLNHRQREPQAVHCGPWFCLSSIALPSVWRSKFAGKPTGSFFGFHRIDKLDNALVDVIASGTLERSNVKAGGARGNAGQHGSCLARGARWPQDNHDASPWIRREHKTLSHRWMPWMGR